MPAWYTKIYVIYRPIHTCAQPICTSQVVLSHTPMRRLVPEFGDRPVLVSGRGSVLKVSDGGRGRVGCLRLPLFTPHPAFSQRSLMACM